MSNAPLALAQPPYQSAMVDKNGMLTPAWQKWYELLYIRVGGAVGAPIANLNDIPLSNLIAASAPNVRTSMYTVPLGQRAVMNAIQIVNTVGTPQTFSIWFVAQGEMPNATNIVANNLTIAGGASLSIPGIQYAVINGGGSIQVLASNAGVLNILASGRLST